MPIRRLVPEVADPALPFLGFDVIFLYVAVLSPIRHGDDESKHLFLSPSIEGGALLWGYPLRSYLL